MRKILLVALFALLPFAALAQQSAPSVLPGCVYNATPPTLSDKQSIVWQCDINGKLITTATGGGGGTPGGSDTQLQYNNAGSFGGISGATTNGTFVTLTTPVLGVAAATSINKVPITAPATSATLTIADGKTLTVSNTLTFTGTDGSTLNVGTGGTLGTAAYKNTGTSGNNVPLLDGANTWSAAQIIAPASPATSLTLTGGTITTDLNLLSGTQTWNNAAVTFTALKLNVTSTASAAASLLMDLQVGGTSKFYVDKGGNVNADTYYNLAATQGINFASAASVRIFGPGSVAFAKIAGSLQVISTDAFSWSADTTSTTAGDLFLRRDAANTLAQRNGTTAQLFNIYKTFTDASNYSRLAVGSDGVNYIIGTLKAGTGTAQSLYIGTNITGAPDGPIIIQGTTQTFATTAGTSWTMSASGHFLAGTDNTYDIGASGATRPRTGYFATSLRAPVYASVGTVPTLVLSGGTCAGTAIAGGSTAGTVTLTGVCVATNTMTLSVMPTAPTGYACDAVNRTLGTVALAQTGTSTTTAVFTFLATTGATDVLAYKCIAY